MDIPEKMGILLVEDDPEDLMLVQNALQETPYVRFNIRHTDNLGPAVALLAQEYFDLVLLDLSLPDSQGMETLHRLSAKAPGVPVVVFTGLGDEASGIQALRSGAQDYLVKGQVDADALFRSLRYAIERHRLQVELEETRAQQQAEHARDQEIDSYRNYQGAVDDAGASASPPAHGITGNTREGLLAKYISLVVKYLRAVRLHEPRPSSDVRALAMSLADQRAGARDVVRLHLGVLDSITKRASYAADEKEFASDARLVLLELIGSLLDIYRENACRAREMGGPA